MHTVSEIAAQRAASPQEAFLFGGAAAKRQTAIPAKKNRPFRRGEPLKEQQVVSLISPRLDPISKVDEYEREALL